jgi:hypothetical protein
LFFVVAVVVVPKHPKACEVFSNEYKLYIFFELKIIMNFFFKTIGRRRYIQKNAITRLLIHPAGPKIGLKFIAIVDCLINSRIRWLDRTWSSIKIQKEYSHSFGFWNLLIKDQSTSAIFNNLIEKIELYPQFDCINITNLL